MKLYFITTSVFFLILVSVNSCKVHHFRSNYRDANALLHATDSVQIKPFLKAHMKNGDIYIMRDTWALDTLSDRLTGNGNHYDLNRQHVRNGDISIPIDSVVIFETNNKLKNPERGRIAALTILTALDAGVGIFCLMNPKACFGSCPTFYLDPNKDFHGADAEGFSNAIAPSMQYADVDALSTTAHGGDTLRITMKNEALETHCVDAVKLLAVSHKPDESVYQGTDGRYYLCSSTAPLHKALAEEGEITDWLNKADKTERFSLADSSNLSSKEEIILNFNREDEGADAGLILNFRQTLMTTYFIYNAMGYMGDCVGDVFAKIETGDGTRQLLKNGLMKELGRIEVFVWNETDQTWIAQGGYYETGPIAANEQLLPLTCLPASGHVQIKLVLNKGLWRIDHAVLAEIEQEVKPQELLPITIAGELTTDSMLIAQNLKHGEHIISMPGDEFEFTWVLPAGEENFDLFLYTEGYYLEWMRESWLHDKDLMKLHTMLHRPRSYLQGETANYKKYEADMEEQFWNSRIDTKTFSLYEK
ncbi:MAG: hypothetical protein ACKVOR_07155 [Flavobacteriales bacterium]